MGCLGGWGAFQRWLKAVGACCSDFLCCVIRCAVCIIETHGVQTFSERILFG